MPRLLLTCGLFVSFLGLAGVTSPATAKISHGIVWYGSARDESFIALTAKRYSMGVTGKDESNDLEKVQIKTLNPEFRWYVYNSGTDNYVPPRSSTEEYDELNGRALENGWDPEIAYLHYWDDTRLVLEGDTLFLPGWGGGAAADPAQSRVPVYYKDLTRRICNFSTPQAAALYRHVMVSLAFDTPFTGSNVYPDGIFLDNSAAILFNHGTVLSGGHVREAPFHLLLESTEFRAWWWNQNLGPFLTSLKDTLQSSALWSPDHQQKYLMINVSNVWNDDYALRDVADVLAMEFQYNPVRNPELNAIDQSHQRDLLASGTGLSTFYLATNTRSVAGHTGSFSLPEIMLGNLCWFLLSRTPNSIFYQQGTNSPSTAGWDSLTWIGAMDIADSQLGEAKAVPFVLARGVDPLGNPYAVHAREYDGGLVVLRNRGRWDEGIEPETAVTVPLPRAELPVLPDGRFGFPVNQVTLRNGQGALFLDVVTPVGTLSFTVTREDTRALIDWEGLGESDNTVGFDVYRQGSDTTPIQLNPTLISGQTSFVDIEAPVDETNYWVVEHSRTGGVTWHGPVTLAAAPLGEIRPSLSQNAPNPARAGTGTTIHFRIARPGNVRLEVFDLSGRRVAVLENGLLSLGEHDAFWSGSDERGMPLSPGVYLYRLAGPDGTFARKLLLMW